MADASRDTPWRRRWAVGLAWALVVVVFASQWYAYDASRGGADPFRYYLWWSCYIWALLTPSALWLAWRLPIAASNWRTRLPLHIGASLALACIQLSLEAYLGWLRSENQMSAASALHHYFSQHLQVSLATYWLLVAGVFFYKSRQEARDGALRSARLTAQLAAARLEVLRRQLHPHFLFNTLHAATTLVHEDPDRAEEVLLRLSDLLRVSLHESQIQEIPLSRELAILDHYMAIELCRFQDRLQFDVRVDRALLSCLVPSLLLQPLVENAVRHGVGVHKGSDRITIGVSRDGDCLRLAVCNVASSLDHTSRETPGRGLGLATTRERLEELYGKEQSSLRLRRLDPSGVCAEVMIPWRVETGTNAPATVESECRSIR